MADSPIGVVGKAALEAISIGFDPDIPWR